MDSSTLATFSFNKLKCQKLNALMHVAGNYVNQIHSISVNNLIVELDMGSK